MKEERDHDRYVTRTRRKRGGVNGESHKIKPFLDSYPGGWMALHNKVDVGRADF